MLSLLVYSILGDTDMNNSTTGAAEIQSFPLEPASPLMGCYIAPTAIALIIMSIVEAAQLALPHLPTQQLSEEIIPVLPPYQSGWLYGLVEK